MCPKLKPEKVILHRFELQQTERDSLEMVAASMTARNVTKSLNNLVTPITQATPAGAILGVTILSVAGVSLAGILAAEAGLLDKVRPETSPAAFFLNPGAWIASKIASPKNIQSFTNEFDKRMRDMNPPSI
jgi:hypothetical protein